MTKNIKEKIFGWMGSISGISGIMGPWQVCYNICLVLIAFLGIFGISVAGMPLAFLIKFAVPLWSIVFVLLIIIIIQHLKKKCISRNMILFNSGLIILGVPFYSLQNFSLGFYLIGGVLVTLSIIIFSKNKIRRLK